MLVSSARSTWRRAIVVRRREEQAPRSDRQLRAAQRILGEALDQRRADAVDQIRLMNSERSRSARFKVAPRVSDGPDSITELMRLQQLQTHLCYGRNPGRNTGTLRPRQNRGKAPWNSAISRSATITTRTTRARRTSSSPTSPTRRSMPTSSACIRPGSASIISTRSACCPVPIWCWPISPRARTHPPRARRHGAAAASSDPRRRAMGDARPSQQRRVDFAAGRGYDRREYLPFDVSFEDNQSIFDEGLELVRTLWAADERIDHMRQALSVRGCAHHAASRCSGRSRPMWRRSPSRRSSLPRGSAAV